VCVCVCVCVCRNGTNMGSEYETKKGLCFCRCNFMRARGGKVSRGALGAKRASYELY
jgi:hypothetical protein